MPVPLLIDTDLGSDVDDELALAMVWGSPELLLRGVTTTYGDVGLRARIVLRMAELAGRDVDVATGAALPRSRKPVWWAGHEGAMYDSLPRLRSGPADPASGVGLLVERSAGAQLLAIGPLTTVAGAIDAGARPDRVVLMGGDWSDPAAAEHNLASDVVAAERVLGSGLPVDAVGIDVTRRVRFGEPEVLRFARCGHLGAVLAAEMHAWMRRWNEDFEVPHDPLTALSIVEPDLFAFAEPAAVDVSAGGPDAFGPAGAVRRTGAGGTVRVATGVDVDAARTAMADRIAAGLGERRRTPRRGAP